MPLAYGLWPRGPKPQARCFQLWEIGGLPGLSSSGRLAAALVPSACSDTP